MNILVISHMYPSNFSGMDGIFVHQQVKEVAKLGHNIKVVSPKPLAPFPLNLISSRWKGYAGIPDKDIIDGIEVFYPREIEFPRGAFFSSSGKRMFSGIKGIIERIYKDFKFDIIHAHVALPDGYAGMELAKIYNVPLVVTIHGQDMQYTIFENNRCREYVKRVIDYSNKTVMVSNKLKNIAIKDLKIEGNKLQVIPNGINLEEVRLIDSNLKAEYGDRRILFSASNLIQLKGIDFNIRAIAKLKDKYPDLLYLIAGDGNEKDNLIKLSQELDIMDKIVFLGQIPHEEVMDYMALCDIFSLPSWNEGFGVVYAEAMANGKPIILCQGQGLSDVIADKINGLLIKPKDFITLAEAMDYLLDNPIKAKEIGSRGKELVLNNFTWEKNAQKTNQLYMEVTAECH